MTTPPTPARDSIEAAIKRDVNHVMRRIVRDAIDSGVLLAARFPRPTIRA